MRPTRRTFRYLLLISAVVAALFSATACKHSQPPTPPPDPGLLTASSETIAWDDIKPWLTWNSPFSPRSDAATGDRVTVQTVASEADWDAAYQAGTAACPSADFNQSFVKAYYQAWRDTVVIAYCFREGMPDAERFQIYFLPVLELPLSAQPPKAQTDSAQADAHPSAATQGERVAAAAPAANLQRDSENGETDEQPADTGNAPPEPESPGGDTPRPAPCAPHPEATGMCLDDAALGPLKPESLRIFFARSRATNFETQDAQAVGMSRVLIIEAGDKLFLVNLMDVHPYLAAETRARLEADPSKAGLLHANELYWRRIQPAVLDLGGCRTCFEDGTPLFWRDQQLQNATEIRPRVSCVPRADILPGDLALPVQYGFATFTGYDPTRTGIGYLLVKQGDKLAVVPLNDAAAPRHRASKHFTVQVPGN